MKTKTIYFTNGTCVNFETPRQARKYLKKACKTGGYHKALCAEDDGHRIQAFFNPNNPLYRSMMKQTTDRWYKEAYGEEEAVGV